ncbi:hypothetical protein CPB85DRAFT_1438986 [Mucidula mucida]|nr:hypothetical protein CPB85DRAFT_1438986 [Mucidula mucida]
MNHLFFNTYPPSGIRFVVPLLALETVPRPQPASVVRHCSVDVLDFPRSLDRLSPFYPLANIPGPAIDKVTKLMWCSVDIDRHEADARKVWARSPNEVSIIDVAAIKPVLGQLPKGPFHTIRAPNKFGSLLLLTGEAHTVRRKRWARGLNGLALKEYEESLLNRTKQLVEQLKLTEGEVVDFARWINFVA